MIIVIILLVIVNVIILLVGYLDNEPFNVFNVLCDMGLF